MLAVEAAPSVGGSGALGVRVRIDRRALPPGALRTGGPLGAGPGPQVVWVAAALRVDGDLVGRFPEVSAAQRAALRTLTAVADRPRAQLALLRAAEQLVLAGRGGGGAVWDPRLEEVATLVAAALRPLRSAERAIGPATGPATVPASGAATGDVEWAWQELGGRQAPLLVAWHVANLRIAAVCTEVAGHARTVAGRAADPAIAARYRRLAADCAALAAGVAASTAD